MYKTLIINHFVICVYFISLFLAEVSPENLLAAKIYDLKIVCSTSHSQKRIAHIYLCGPNSQK